jgi:hypothetical protein
MNELDLHNKIKSLEDEIIELKEKLKTYTAPKRNKKFYDNHKDELIQRNKEYREKTNYDATIPIEKKKEYARRAYLNKKEKAKQNAENENN